MVTAHELNIEGSKYYSEGDYKKALECFEESLKLNAIDATVLCNKANSLFALGRHNRAKEVIGAALILHPNNDNIKKIKEIIFNKSHNVNEETTNKHNQNIREVHHYHDSGGNVVITFIIICIIIFLIWLFYGDYIKFYIEAFRFNLFMSRLGF
ncbi:hypothetical protein CEE44_00300 [Candidatus Woesearchaeota archaeon B3_Woes]|nr:MAG: hypothetical protein CEE44_00300 [Candidatus Woesearchaeota archaeon B3_Woes]